jgi:hypothetical protein
MRERVASLDSSMERHDPVIKLAVLTQLVMAGGLPAAGWWMWRVIVKLGRAAQDRSNQRSNPSDINTHRASVNIISVTKHTKSPTPPLPANGGHSWLIIRQRAPRLCIAYNKLAFCSVSARAPPNGRLNCAIPRFTPLDFEPTRILYLSRCPRGVNLCRWLMCAAVLLDFKLDEPADGQYSWWAFEIMRRLPIHNWNPASLAFAIKHFLKLLFAFKFTGNFRIWELSQLLR